MEIDVIYEEGVFKPLKKVDLKEGTRLTFIIGKDRVEKILQDLKNLEPLDIEIDDERREWDYYAETMSLQLISFCEKPCCRYKGLRNQKLQVITSI